MTTIPARSTYRTPVIRRYALALGATLAFAALWMVAPDAYLWRSKSSNAGWTAAELAWLRGDLWARAADVEAGPAEPPSDNTIRASKTAVRFAPVDARSWLRLARASLPSSRAQAAAELKMSFYTGPSDDDFVLDYVDVLSQLDVSSDEELQYLLERQVDKIVQHHPDLRPALVTAYRRTSIKNQQYFQKLIAAIDPAFAASLPAPQR